MRGVLSTTLAVATLLSISACNSSRSKPAMEPQYRSAGTIKDIMDSMVDPSADFLWDSVSTFTDVKGTVERSPKTDAEWVEVRYRAIAIMEAANLLLMPGRQVALPGEKAENPNIEESPEEIKKLIDADRQTWISYANDLYDSAGIMKSAIEARDVNALSVAGEHLDKACERCHEKYWYPHQYDNAPKSNGASDNQVNPVPVPGKPEL